MWISFVTWVIFGCKEGNDQAVDSGDIVVRLRIIATQQNHAWISKVCKGVWLFLSSGLNDMMQTHPQGVQGCMQGGGSWPSPNGCMMVHILRAENRENLWPVGAPRGRSAPDLAGVAHSTPPDHLT